MLSFVKRFARAREGVAAIEFALIAPLLLVTFFGISEVANYVLAARKVANVASTAADLVSQDTSITDTEMTDIMDSLRVILRPFNDSNARIIISEIDADNTGKLTWAWSDARNDVAHTPGTQPSANALLSDPNVTLSDIVPNNQGIVVAEISFTYQTLFGMYLRDGMTVSDVFFLKPRRSTHVARE